MLNYTGDFKTGINSASREVSAKIAYLSENDKINYLGGKDIQSLNYTSQGKKELGCVVKKVIEATLIYNENTSKLKNGSFINVIYVCSGECKVDIFYINDLKSKNNKQLITLQAVDMVTYINDNPVDITMPLVRDTTLKNYIETMFKALKFEYRISDDISNPKLVIGYPKSTAIVETLEEMAIASNSMIALKCTDTFGITLPFYLPRSFDELLISNTVDGHVQPFRFDNPCTNIEQYINYEIDDDSADVWNDVRICLFFPGSSDQKNIGSMKTLVPPSTTNYDVGKVNFQSTCVPQICKVVNERINISKYRLGSDNFNICLNNTSPLSQNIEAEFLGIDIKEASALEATTENNSNIKVINNLYIQGPSIYDTRIYKSKNISIKYFGNPLIEVGDTITIDGITVLVIEHSLKYSGGLRGTIKGVVLNE